MTKPTDLQFNLDNIKAMLDELAEFHDSDQLSRWEKSFIGNIRTLVGYGEDLSSAQFDRLTEIYKEYCE